MNKKNKRKYGANTAFLPFFVVIFLLLLGQIKGLAYTNVSILDPDGNENYDTSKLGYFQYSTDGGVTWSSLLTD